MMFSRYIGIPLLAAACVAIALALIAIKPAKVGNVIEAEIVVERA